MTPLTLATNMAMWHFSDNNPANSSGRITQHCSLTGCSFTTGRLLYLSNIVQLFLQQHDSCCLILCKCSSIYSKPGRHREEKVSYLMQVCFKRDGDGKLDVYVKGFQPNISLPYAAGDGNDIWWCPGVFFFFKIIIVKTSAWWGRCSLKHVVRD